MRACNRRNGLILLRLPIQKSLLREKEEKYPCNFPKENRTPHRLFFKIRRACKWWREKKPCYLKIKNSLSILTVKSKKSVRELGMPVPCVILLLAPKGDRSVGMLP